MIYDYDNFVDVKIVYTEAITELRLYKGRFPFYINRIEVLSDNDFPPPFLAILTIKNIGMSILNNSKQENGPNSKSYFEDLFQKKITEWDGYQTSLFVLNTKMMDY